MKIFTFLIVFFILLSALVLYINNQPPEMILKIQGNILNCEIADTFEKRELGLMKRNSLGENNGMVFIYPDEELRTFWMKNCNIPLSIAFADRNGIIVHMAEMIVDETTTYSSEKEVMYAVEANKGWFTSHFIRVGDKIDGIKSTINK